MIDIGKPAVSLSHVFCHPLKAIKEAVVYLKNRYRHETTRLESAASAAFMKEGFPVPIGSTRTSLMLTWVTNERPVIRDRSGEDYSVPLDDTTPAPKARGFCVHHLGGPAGQQRTFGVRSGDELGTTLGLCFTQEIMEEAR